ncbi:ribonuclease H-like domain-containing protein [Tanacetum coccineum]
MSDHDNDASDINNDNTQPQQQQDEYEVWAMKMEYWITNNDMNIWKARNYLLQSIPDDHVADFHYMNDARDIWNAVKARFGGNAESKKMRKSMLKQEFSEFRISESEAIAKKGMTGCRESSQSLTNSRPSLMMKTSILSFSEVCLHLGHRDNKASYEDFEQIDKLDLKEMDIKWQMAMLLVRVNKFEKKARRKIEFDKKEVARFNKKAVRCYMCLQKGHFARECRAKGGNEKRYSSFKIQELGKKEADTKALITVDTLEN